ncbi:hypothetical protein CK203_069450 [Vitis vinifera]|uniref:J domain-containing protein n=1 Tax=Vitis vinifera TaxID=29760 RepID=A0A438BZY5_VITVI|nr:hypothetical protein CK203_069450 [Vitis vinifera]
MPTPRGFFFTEECITQCTPKREKIRSHNILAFSQNRRRRSVVSSLFQAASHPKKLALIGTTWISLEELKREKIDAVSRRATYMRGSETTDKQLGTSRDLYLFLKSNHMKRSNYLAHQVDPVAMQKRLNKLIDVCHQWKKSQKWNSIGSLSHSYLKFYNARGIKPSETAADIKKAYRKAALRHHPDKAGQFLARSEGGDDGQLWKEIAEEVHKDADRLFKNDWRSICSTFRSTKVCHLFD